MDIIYYQKFFPPWIRAGTTTRKFGNFKIGNPEEKESWQRLAVRLQVSPEDIVRLNQKHTANILEPNKKKFANYSIGDGLIAINPRQVLVIKTADCLPIFLAETQKKIICALHAGRIGTLAGIARKAVLAIKKYGGDNKFIKVLIGPGIEAKCYTMDLLALNKQQLLETGVLENNIFTISVCTKCNRDCYFSYRGGDKEARMASFIYIDSRGRGNDKGEL